MGFPLQIALRYMGSKKRAFVSLGTSLAILGVALGTACLSIVVSVTGGFRSEFREKVLGVNAHVLVLKYSSDFREYRSVMQDMKDVPGVIGVAPFVINPMMVSHKDKTATGVLLKGVDPKLFGDVLDLPKHIVEGSTEGLRAVGAKPPESSRRMRIRESPLDAPGGTKGNPNYIVDLEDSVRDGGVSAKDLLDDTQDADASDEQPDAAPGEPEAEQSAARERGETPGAPGASPPPNSDALPEDAPQGSIVPEGGYESVLPDPDFIPEELDEDPCKSAELVKKLPGIIIGKSLGEYLGAGIGSCLQVTSPTVGFSFGSGGFRPPVAKRFRVIAIFDAGFDQYDSKLVYTDLYEAQAFHSNGDSVTGVEMKIDHIDDSQHVKALVDEKLKSSIYHTMDWKELNHGLFTALQIQQITISLVLALMILVAAFTVLATLIMVVLDKKKEIAVMKAMGATDWALVRAFLYQGGIIGVLGAGSGLGLGYAVCYYLTVDPFPLDPKVYFISYLPVQVDPVWFLAAGFFSVAVCLIGSLWPAVHAARLRPAEAFREQ
ncbi:MAG: ABC transporter permease [Myxococcales bacterium]|nr:ABC transporter permease [Myxococcales bacterium]